MQDENHDITRLQQLASLGELAAGVTHETRNVLTAIVGFVQLAKRNGETGKRHLELIEREAIRAVEILEQFLSLNRVAAEGSEDCDVGQVIREIVSAASHQASLHRTEIVMRADVSVVRMMLGRSALLQVLLNLVLNAMYASPSSGGAVEIEASLRDRVLAIVVSDNGAGVPAELREQIFAPFFSTKPNGEGTGLGLAVSRRLVEAAGGTIACEPRSGGGAAFVVRLPAEEVS